MITQEHKECSQVGTKSIRGRFIIQEIQDPVQEESKLKSSILTTDSGRRLNKSKSQSKFRTNSKPNALNITNKKFDIFLYEINQNSYINSGIVLFNIIVDNKIKRPIFRSKLHNLLCDFDDTSPSLGNHNSPSLLKHVQLSDLAKKIRRCSYDFISHNLQSIVMSQSIQFNNKKPHHSFCIFPMTPIPNHPHEEVMSLYRNQTKLNELLNAFSGYEYDLLKEIQVNSFSILSYSIYRCSFNL